MRQVRLQRLERRHPCLQRRVFQRRDCSTVSNGRSLFVLRTHAGRDLCASVVRASILLALFPVVALAHEGEPHDFADLIRTWSFDPLVVVLLATSATVYIAGVRRMWRRAGRSHGISKWNAVAFACGWMSMFIALVSPLHSWGEVLFSAHMTQHEILMLISAPLFVIGRPFIAAMWALPGGARLAVGSIFNESRLKIAWRWFTAPFVAWLVHAIALWTWHVPALFQATLKSDVVHTFQHASFFLTALVFWWAILTGRRGPASYGAGILYLFTTSIHSGLLGVLLTLTPRVWYPAYSDSTISWGLTPIEDQQLGGLIMWIPASVIYIAAALFLFTGWLSDSERRTIRRESVIDASSLPLVEPRT